VSEKASPFAAGIANLRETSKWLISGVFGAAVLLVGGVSFSDLGDLDSDDRLQVAIGSLAVASGLCGLLIFQAVQVLRSQVFSLTDFSKPRTVELLAAYDKVAPRAKALPGGVSLAYFADEFETLQSQAWDAAPDRPTALDAWNDYEAARDYWCDACIAALVQKRFEVLAGTLSWAGLGILAAMLVFAIAAHPPEGARLIAKPYAEPLTDQQALALRAQGVRDACVAPGALLVVATAPKDGSRTAILVGPQPHPKTCVAKVTISGDALVLVK